MAVAATKSKKQDSGSDAAEEEESDSSFQIIRRRKKMKVAAPGTVMVGSMGYSKAAQYATLSRVDVAGAQVRSQRSHMP